MAFRPARALRRRRPPAVVVGALAFALVLAGCGGSEGDDGSSDSDIVLDSSSTVAETTAIIGTAAYFSPEQAKGEPVVVTLEYEQWDEFTEKNVRACVDWFNAYLKQ